MSTLRFATKGLLASLAFSFATASFAATALQTPPSLQIPSGKTEKDVKEAIALGATARTWIIKDIEPGLIEARVDVRNKHTLIVNLKYDAKEIALKYKNSVNLDYEVVDGTPMIHRNANSWMQNLMTDINKFLNR